MLPEAPEPVSATLATSGGDPVEVCEIDETNYINPDANAQTLGRAVLAGQHAVVLLPREALTPATTYEVRVATGVVEHAWSFRVAGDAETMVELGSSANPASPGEEVTLVAEVRPSQTQSPSPTGSITFFDHGAAIGTAALDSQGRAKLTFSPLLPGTHEITAYYGGSSRYDPATSLAYLQRFSHTVNAQGSDTFGYGNPGLSGPAVQACGDPVNCLSGNFFEELPDLAVGGRGRPLNFVRTYNALGAAGQQVPGPLGYGWTHNYAKSLIIDDANSKITVVQGNGSTVPFAIGPYDYLGPPQATATLVGNEDGTYTYTYADQAKDVFDNSGVLLREVDRNGYVTSLSYTDGLLTSVTDPAQRVLRFTYLNRELTQVTDPAGRSVSFRHNPDSTLLSATDPASQMTSYGYDSLHRLTTVTDPMGGTVTNVFDPQNRVTSQTDPMGRTMTWAYDTATATTTITDGAGRRQEKTFDSSGNLVSLTRGVGTAEAATWRYTYDSHGNPLSATDPNGHTTTSTWDNRGNRLSVTDALGRGVHSTYDERNNLTSVTDASAVTTTMAYDARGNLTSIDRPLTGTGQSATTTFIHDPTHAGDIVQIIDPTGKVWRRGYDSAGNLVRTENALGEKTTFAYNAVGWLTAATSARGNALGANPADFTTTFGHSPLGELEAVTDPLGNTARASYDDKGNQVAVTDAEDAVTTFQYNLNTELTAVHLPDGAINETRYDASGLVVAQADGLGASTTYAYDALHRPISTTDPLGRSTRWAYDGADNLKTMVDAANRSKNFTYDAADQLMAIDYSDENTHDVTFKYDADGRRIEMLDGSRPSSNGGGKVTYTYDSLGRLTSHTTGSQKPSFLDTQTTGYGYDLAGRLTSLQYPIGVDKVTDPLEYPIGSGTVTNPMGGGTVTRAYDDAGRLAAVTDWLNRTTRFGYDPDGNLANIAYPNGVDSSFSWDRGGRASRIIHANAEGTFSANYPYERDGDGRLTGDNPTGAGDSVSVGYRYDPRGRLTRAATAGSAVEVPTYSYGYDAADNLTQESTATLTTTSRYDAANQLIDRTGPAGEGEVYTYDQLGNRTSYSVGAGDSTTEVARYEYDQENRLVRTTGRGYRYHGDGLRSYLFWDLSQSLPLIIGDPNGDLYITGPGGIPIQKVSADANEEVGNTTWYHHDQLGSTVALTDTTGQVRGTYTYDPYGNSIPSDTSIVNPFRYAGQYTDSVSGLVYMRARWYDPATAQFLTKDPLVALSGQPYAYANNSPLNFTDPTGQIPFLVIGAAVWGVIEVGGAILDAHSTAQTFADPCASGWDKAVSGGLFVGGVFLPGAGYSTGARAARAPRALADLPARDATGKIHWPRGGGSVVPTSVPRNWNLDDLEFMAEELRGSIRVRTDTFVRLGNSGGHGVQLQKEKNFLHSVEARIREMGG